MRIAGVMFDFAGTLFNLEPTPRWQQLLGSSAAVSGPEGMGTLLRKLTSPPPEVADFDAEHRHAWENRDRDPKLHRASYLEVLRQAGVEHPSMTTAVYELMLDPLSWTPYPDTVPALRSLAERGIAVAVVSNIAFDIRPVFRACGVDDAVTAYVLSYEHGVVKPEPGIFHVALDAMGVPGSEALMVGDNTSTDGAATELGCSFAYVWPGPVDDRRDGPRGALDEHGLG